MELPGKSYDEIKSKRKLLYSLAYTDSNSEKFKIFQKFFAGRTFPMIASGDDDDREALLTYAKMKPYGNDNMLAIKALFHGRAYIEIANSDDIDREALLTFTKISRNPTKQNKALNALFGERSFCEIACGDDIDRDGLFIFSITSSDSNDKVDALKALSLVNYNTPKIEEMASKLKERISGIDLKNELEEIIDTCKIQRTSLRFTELNDMTPQKPMFKRELVIS